MNYFMLSTCVKCSGRLFELKEQAPSGSAFKLQFVQCSSCGVPVGVMEYFNAGVKLDKLEKRMSQVESQIGYMQDSLRNIQAQLHRR